MKIRHRRSEQVLGRVSSIRLTVRGRQYQFDLKRELALTVEESEDILLSATERFMFWGRMLADLEDQRDRLELELDEQKAHYAIQLARTAKAGEVRNQIKLQPKVLELEQKLLNAKHQCRVVGAIVAAMDYRRTIINKLWRQNQ